MGCLSYLTDLIDFYLAGLWTVPWSHRKLREKKLSGWRQLKKLQPVAMDPWRKSRLGFKILEIARGVGGRIIEFLCMQVELHSAYNKYLNGTR